MSDSNKVTGDGADVSDLPSSSPAGVTVQQQDGAFVMCFKELARAGYVVLGLSAWFIITVLVYGFVNNVPTSELVGASVIFAVLLYFAVAMIISVSTVSVSDNELVVARGPLPLWFTKRLPLDLITSLHVKVHVNKNSQTYSLAAARSDGKRPKRLVGFGRDQERAKYFLRVLSRTLGLPEGKNLRG